MSSKADEPLIDWDRPLSRKDILRYGAGFGFGVVGAGMLSSCVPFTAESKAAAWDDVPAAESKYTVIVVIDACRGDYLSYGNLPNLNSLINSGTLYTNAWCGIMESITPACHASLSTGSFPRDDGGILGFWWEDPKTHLDFNSANTALSPPTGAPDPATLEKLIRRSGSPTLAGLLKAADPTAKVYAASGPKFYAADAAGGPDADYITYLWNDDRNGCRPLSISPHDLPADILNDPAFYYGPNNPGPAIANGMSADSSQGWNNMINDHPGLQDAMTVDLALKVVERERPRVVILNLPEMDYPVAHVYGGPLSPSKVTHVMENADRKIGQLMDRYKELGIFKDTTWAILGDHGVTPLQQRVDPSAVPLALKNAGTAFSGEWPYLTHDYHTGGFIWMEDPSKAMKVATFLDEARMPGVSAIYALSGLGSRQYFPSPATASNTPSALDSAYRYLLSTMNGANAAHVVLIYEERTGTDGIPTSGPQWHGDHGGASWGSQHIPLILSGPGVRKGLKSTFPARLVDVAPTCLRLMGVKYPGMDGLALADAFQKPVKAEVTAQRASSVYLKPAAASLRLKSVQDIRKLGRIKPISKPKLGYGASNHQLLARKAR